MLLTFVTIILAVVAIVAVVIVVRYFRLWLQGYVSRARIGIVALVMLSLRGVDPWVIMHCKVMAAQAGLRPVPTREYEALSLAGGNVERVVLALIIAARAGIELDWTVASAIDLAGRDVLEAVRISVNPQVIECPSASGGSRTTLDGVAQDGIQVRVRAGVTVRTNLSQLIGGATEATIIARVGQGIVAAIGACPSYRDALADPRLISRNVIAAGLDSQTAFAIVSIDIAEISVGENLGARLQIEQANADVRIARAQAEQQRATAVAHLREMHALTREHEAALVLAEVELVHEIATAFRTGNMRAGLAAVAPPRCLRVLASPAESA
jgi:uncharacterized protein YqfA (UPF0365 family)